MQQGPGKFELTLSLREVVVLFFVMIVLFTGLLFFGFRIGYTQSGEAIRLQSQPLAPAQENPETNPQPPTIEAEPEIRLENSLPQIEERALWAAALPGVAALSGVIAEGEGKAPAPRFGEHRPWPCRAEARPFHVKDVAASDAVLPEAEDSQPSHADEVQPVQPATTPEAGATSGLEIAADQQSPPRAPDCAPIPRRPILRSMAC
jgi:hypothetical protein